MKSLLETICTEVILIDFAMFKLIDPGTNRLLKYLSTHNGITVHHVDTTNVDTVKPFLNENTALVLLETPTNPLIKIVDIPTISRHTHDKCPRGIVVVDNTMLSPYLQNPLDLGADIVYESATKYLSGHHDLMAGVLAVHDAALGDVLFLTSQLTLETILYHQYIRMWSFSIRLLAPSPRSKDTSSPYGKATSQRRPNRPLPRITRL
jgi:cystathionine beta-lyase/cystathionine gamma-synthase